MVYNVGVVHCAVGIAQDLESMASVAIGSHRLSQKVNVDMCMYSEEYPGYLRIDRQDYEVAGPFTRTNEQGHLLTRFILVRRSDGGRLEVKFAEGETAGTPNKVCSITAYNGWAGEAYDGCTFFAIHCLLLEEEPPRHHWGLWWGTPESKQAKVWPGHFTTDMDAPYEHICLLAAEQIEAGIERIELSQRELVTPA